jgi:TetR/AcrR family transcriptional regulator, cholesterol catabolism regulator
MFGVLGMHNWTHQWYVPGGRRSLTEIGHVFAEMILSGLRP